MTSQNTALGKVVRQLDWDCTDDETQYLTHAIHRYSGKFIPQIARQAIELLTKPGERILDPFCGSGTSLLEATLIGRHSIGLDINPLATLISRVKTTRIPEHSLSQLNEELKQLLSPLTNRRPQLDLFGTRGRYELMMSEAREDTRFHDDWYRKWYQDEVLLELIAIHRLIMSQVDTGLRDVALVAFSDILRKSSNANSSYPNVMYDKRKGKVASPTPRFLARLDELCEMVATLETALTGQPRPLIVLSSARSIPLVSDGSIDAVITHPPYIASIPYAEYGALSLTWLGHNPRALDKTLTGGMRHSSRVVEKFMEGYSESLAEIWRVLKPGGKAFFLVGNPTVRGQVVDLIKLTVDIAESIGFELWAQHSRAAVNRRANLMGREGLLFLHKVAH